MSNRRTSSVCTRATPACAHRTRKLQGKFQSLVFVIEAIVLTGIVCENSALADAWVFESQHGRAALVWRGRRFRHQPCRALALCLGVEEQLASLSRSGPVGIGTSSSSALPTGSLVEAAASVTQESCRLLGLRSIGVDYGLVRTGIARTVGYEPEPLTILVELNNTQVCKEVIRYAAAERASQIILGLPLHKNGSVAEQTNLTLSFGRQLAQVCLQKLGPDIPVLLWDERYTSKEAAARAHSRDPHRYLHGTLDAEAACIILEHYYHDNGRGVQTIELDQDVRRDCLHIFERSQQADKARLLEAQEEREQRMQRRRDAIARVQKLEAEMASTSGMLNSSSKKKRKKRKKRR